MIIHRKQHCSGTKFVKVKLACDRHSQIFQWRKTSIPTNKGVFAQRIQRYIYRNWLLPRTTLQYSNRQEHPSSTAPTKTSTCPPTTSIQRELERFTDIGITTEVENEFTSWVNSVVGTTKVHGSIRFDPRDLNKAMKRNAYYTRNVDNVIPQVSGSTLFSILDARSGY